jgi:hypothetical protein
MADDAKKVEAPEEVLVVIRFIPKTGQMNFTAPRDPIIALGMLDMARREVYRQVDANQVPAGPKIEIVPAHAIPKQG